MSLVLDGSVALAWCFKDESTAAIDLLMLRVAEAGAIVPAIWRLEIANGLRTAMKRKRIGVATRDNFLAALGDMDIAIDAETHRYAWSATLRLADRHDLTPYDASYLELAQRLTLPLASIDKAMRKAAKRAAIDVIEL